MNVDPAYERDIRESPDPPQPPSKYARWAPVQADRTHPVAGMISWEEHVEAHRDYAKRHDQTAERIAERGGFGFWELTHHLGHEPRTWRPR